MQDLNRVSDSKRKTHRSCVLPAGDERRAHRTSLRQQQVQ
jgi:hypothetical protein